MGEVTDPYLLRMAKKARAEGRVAGTVEVLGTGEVVPVQSAEELMALLLEEKPSQEP